MDDPLNTPGVPPSEQPQEPVNTPEQIEQTFPSAVIPSEARNPSSSAIQEESDSSARGLPRFTENDHRERNDDVLSVRAGHQGVSRDDRAASQRRGFRQNLFLLLTLTLAAFTLTTWILVRADSPFGIFSTGPQDIVRAQLRALDRGELRPAYDMFSARYRGQVSFDDWHHLIVTHWRMFHAEVLGSKTPANAGPGVTLEIYLHGADDKDYRARFTLIRTDGRWWIDDVHWAEEPDQRDVSRT